MGMQTLQMTWGRPRPEGGDAAGRSGSPDRSDPASTLLRFTGSAGLGLLAVASAATGSWAGAALAGGAAVAVAIVAGPRFRRSRVLPAGGREEPADVVDDVIRLDG